MTGRTWLHETKITTLQPWALVNTNTLHNNRKRHEQTNTLYWPTYCRKEVHTVSWNAGSFQHIYFSGGHSRIQFSKWCRCEDIMFNLSVHNSTGCSLSWKSIFATIRVFPVSTSLSDSHVSWPFRSYPSRLHEESKLQCSLSLQSFENTEPSFILVTVVSRRRKRCLIQVSNPFFLGVYILYKGQSKQNRVPLDMVSHGTVHL